jgi:quinol monooxygenase YgiN
MAVKVVIEFQAKPGQRTELQSLMESMGERFGPIMRERGALGFALYEVPDNPDMIVEIAEWETAEAREALMEEAVATGGFAPMMELLAKPPRATYLRQLP